MIGEAGRRHGAATVLRAVVLAAALTSLDWAAPASAARLVTWYDDSRFVDERTEPFGIPPPGARAGGGLRVNVLLPDGYDGRRRFPVVYLMHGAGERYDWAAHAERGDVARTVKGLDAIVVMPESGAVGFNVNWWNGGLRRRPAWERYHLAHLVPLVERRLRIRPGRRWHAVGGFSMGAYGGVYYASQRPDYFGSVVSLSGSMSLRRPETIAIFDYYLRKHGRSFADVWGDEHAQDFYRAGHDPLALVPNLRHTRLYLTHGDGTYRSEDELDDGRGPDNPALAVAIEANTAANHEEFVAAARAEHVRVRYEPVQTLRLRGRRLSASGAGRVRIRDRCGGSFTARLPFERRLARRCPPG